MTFSILKEVDTYFDTLVIHRIYTFDPQLYTDEYKNGSVTPNKFLLFLLFGFGFRFAVLILRGISIRC